MYETVHYIHHSRDVSAILGWCAHPIEHLFLNIGSVAFPFFVFNNTKYILTIIAILEAYWSVSGHVKHTPHHIHHIHMNKRFGSIYIIDRLFGSY